MGNKQPNILIFMSDHQRADTVSSDEARRYACGFARPPGTAET